MCGSNTLHEDELRFYGTSSRLCYFFFFNLQGLGVNTCSGFTNQASHHLRGGLPKSRLPTRAHSKICFGNVVYDTFSARVFQLRLYSSSLSVYLRFVSKAVLPLTIHSVSKEVHFIGLNFI
jgi:hypothetical protein